MAKFLRLPIALIATCTMASPLQAAAVIIWPVDPVIEAGQSGTVLWIQNKDPKPVTVQVRAFAWSQTGGQDVLDKQSEMVASPPIAEIAPGAKQLVRIVRRTPATRPHHAYRLMVDELPPPPASEGGGGVTARLAIQMRYSIPLFVYGSKDKLHPRLVAEVRGTENGAVLVVRNTGGSHARLTNLRGPGDRMIREGLVGYVLPGSALHIPLPLGSGATLKLGVNGVDQQLSASV